MGCAVQITVSSGWICENLHPPYLSYFFNPNYWVKSYGQQRSSGKSANDLTPSPCNPLPLISVMPNVQNMYHGNTRGMLVLNIPKLTRNKNKYIAVRRMISAICHRQAINPCLSTKVYDKFWYTVIFTIMFMCVAAMEWVPIYSYGCYDFCVGMVGGFVSIAQQESGLPTGF